MQGLVVALNATISLVSRTPVNTVDSRFTSWNIDSSCNRGFHFTNFSNPNLRAAALGLAPSRLRFGGSGNDNREHGALCRAWSRQGTAPSPFSVVYGLTPGSPECAGVVADGCDYITPGCLNATQWDDLYGLGQSAGADFIFGVSFGFVQVCQGTPPALSRCCYCSCIAGLRRGLFVRVELDERGDATGLPQGTRPAALGV